MSDLNPCPKLDCDVTIALPSIIGIRAREMVDYLIMTELRLKASELSLHMTSTGYISIDSGQLDISAEIALFGPNGAVPPVSVLSLTETCLDQIDAAPDPSDTADLRLFAKSLKASLEAVETTLSRLDKDNH